MALNCVLLFVFGKALQAGCRVSDEESVGRAVRERRAGLVCLWPHFPPSPRLAAWLWRKGSEEYVQGAYVTRALGKSFGKSSNNSEPPQPAAWRVAVM